MTERECELIQHLTDTLEEKTGEAIRIADGCLRFDARPYGMFTIYAAL